MEKIQSINASVDRVRHRLQSDRLIERSPFYFIVKPAKEKRYDNTVDFGGIDFILSSSIEDHSVSNRIAEVLSLPIGYSGPVSVGDSLVVHHNVFKFYNDMYGNIKSGKSYYKNGLFFIEEDQYFMYKNGDEWIPLEKYCFVKPSDKKNYFINRPGALEPLMGELVYGNKTLSLMGVNPGDQVAFRPDSEYEFRIDGQILYRIFTKDICLKL